ncbi:phage tail terminator protein [Alicycliphilus denitrificans]|uniref:phage tail terminator protein n=1 Tax=Alicycliphilus denitrificans TaxID=179636 RepID=UPI0001D9F297|nr:hypothetical protein [Alicycliphilus denitrificans]ADU99829.1 hypothetical protein Alide_2086 [Alicycliphilus denitrificans BC]
MDLQPILQRLRDELADLQLREIEEAPGLDAAMRASRATPAIYVLPLSERGQGLDHTGDTDQIEHRLFGVLQAVDVMSPTGTPGVVDLATLRRSVKQALIGFVADDSMGEPVLFVGGELVQFEGNGRLWWSDEFGFSGYYDRSNP